MIVNEFVVSYLVLLGLSAGICLPAAGAGWAAARRGRGGPDPAQRERREKNTYLVITLLGLGFAIRLVMIPLWFLTLHSLIPAVPGAMCLAGVHLLDSPFSFAATTLKFIIPLAYLFWLTLNAVDRRIETEPFLRAKLLWVAPLALLLAGESFFDLHFLLRINPRIVSCCTSLFDLPRGGALEAVRSAGTLWTAGFYACLVGALLASVRRLRPGGGKGRLPTALLSLLALLFLILALQTVFSPLLLHAPYHQCVFCLWGNRLDIALASAAAIAGLWLSFVGAALPDLRPYPEAERWARKLSRFALLCAIAGPAWLSVRYLAERFFF